MAVQHAAAVLAGTAYVFVDPTKIVEAAFFKGSPVATQYRQAVTLPVPVVPGQQSFHSKLGPVLTPALTQKGGIPNEG